MAPEINPKNDNNTLNSPSRSGWIDAIFHGPGPTNTRETCILISKGLAMGCADLVPGVSGGTIALITGIYDQLLKAVSSAADGLKEIAGFNFMAGITKIHFRFLLALLAGICAAIVGLAGFMHFLLDNHPIPTWGAFFGLIGASILMVGRLAKIFTVQGLLLFLTGGAAAFLLVGMIPVSTPEALWFIFFSGMIAICAMILPGISGAFLLLILGKYQYVTGAIKNPFIPENIIIIIIFCCGCLTGLLGFSKFLSYMMDRYHNGTMALLTGLMFGSMRKIWPWKEVLESKIIRGKTHIISTQNILPPQIDGEFLITLLLALTGFAVVIFLQKLSSEK